MSKLLEPVTPHDELAEAVEALWWVDIAVISLSLIAIAIVGDLLHPAALLAAAPTAYLAFLSDRLEMIEGGAA